MTFGRRDVFEQVAATLLMAATVLGFTATHERWDVSLIGDSRRWAAALLSVLGVAMLAVTARHIGVLRAGMLGVAAAALAIAAFATASLTPLAMLAWVIVLMWVAAVTSDLFETPHAPLTH